MHLENIKIHAKINADYSLPPAGSIRNKFIFGDTQSKTHPPL